MTARGPMIDGAIRPANPNFDPLEGRTPADYPFLQQQAPLDGSHTMMRFPSSMARFQAQQAELAASPQGSQGMRGGFGGPAFDQVWEEMGDDQYAEQGWEGWPTNPIEAIQEYGLTGGRHGRWPSAFVRAVVYQLKQFRPGPALFGNTLPGVSSNTLQMLSEGMPGALETQAGTVDEWGTPPAQATGNVHIRRGSPNPYTTQYWPAGTEQPK